MLRANNRLIGVRLIGENSLLVECVRVLLERGHLIHGIASSDPAIRRWATDEEIPVSDCGSHLAEFLAARHFDYLFSIVNPRILSLSALTLPTDLAINFHDALLPRDAGHILAQRPIQVEPTDTSYILNLKCLRDGIESFTDLVDDLSSGQVTRTAQDLRKRTYHGWTKRPDGALRISWRPPASAAGCRRKLFSSNAVGSRQERTQA